MGRQSYFYTFKKGLSGEVTLKQRTDSALPANCLQEEGNALQCEQLVCEELKGCLEESRGRVQ